MNVRVPNNKESGHLYIFGVVIALSGAILIVYINFVRLWWKWAKRRRWSKRPAAETS